MLRFALGLALGLAVAAPLAAQELIPERRLIYSLNADLPGGDIGQQRDVTIQACETACLVNAQCTALTFNARANACFLKDGPGAPEFYEGAYSAVVVAAQPGAAERAATRRPDLAFLGDWEMETALTFAKSMGGLHISDSFTAEEHLASAAAEEAVGNMVGAAGFTGAAVNITDSGADWAEYARRALLAADVDPTNAGLWNDRAFQGAINAYLRTDPPAARHNILVTMGIVLERIGRGRETVQALRLAQQLQPRDDTASALEDAIGKYGFRIEANEVQSDLANPRLCATFTEPLVRGDFDYSPFVQMRDAGLTVTVSGDRQICVEGLVHGQRAEVTFREGLPAADGQTTAKDITITAYVRDRSPAVRFPGRGYVLPKSDTAAIPVETVNTDVLALTLYEVSDRNILRAIQSDYFGQPMGYWMEEDFSGRVGAKLWEGTATVGQEVNRDVTTRLPMAEALQGRPAGIYALKAAVPAKDEYTIAPAWQWFVVSDLGITTLSAADGLSVVVRSLGTAGPVAGAEVELLSRANTVLGTAVTDESGIAAFDAGLTRGTGGEEPGLVVIKAGEADMAFLALSDPEFDLSDRGVEGREPAGPVDVFLTTERGAYRAGETVHATALARDATAEAIPGLPLTAIVKRPDGVEYARQLVEDQGAGGHVFAVPIAGNAPRGVWQMELFADLDAAPLATRTFLVEDFLPERIDFTLTAADTPLRIGDVAEITLAARYLFGAPGADLNVEGETLLRAVAELPGFPGYVFGRHDEPFSATLKGMDFTTTDAAGTALVTAPIPEVSDPGAPLEARFAIRVAEGSGRPVERQLTRTLTPSAPMIGVRPLFDFVVPDGSEARFDLIAIGPDLAPVPMETAWEITRIESDYQWYQSYGSWYWEPLIRRIPVTKGAATLGSDPVEIAAPVTWGHYELAVTGPDGAATSTTFYVGWYAPADATSTPDTLEVSLDKPDYAVGDTAVLRLVPRAAGTALIAVLSNRVVELKAVEVQEGENLVPLAVTADWGAGVYVTASVLRPMDVAAGRNPTRSLGLAYASIDPGARALSATLQAPAEAAPRGPLEVAVKVDGLAAGDTAYATIAAVDQGILNLTAFAPPDPQGHYFGQRKLGVGIRDVYGRLIDGLNGAEGEVRSGGDAGAQAKLQSPPPTEELVAYFSGPVTVGPDGMARASFDLPSFNGTVKVMAVVWSAKGVGQASADVLVRDPVVVTASVPRFMAPGDQSRLLLDVVHATGPAGRMMLDVASAGLSIGDVPSGFELADQGKASFAIPVTAKSAGIQTIDVALTTPDGKILRKTLTVPVQVNDPEVARTTRLDLAQGDTFTFDQNAFAGLDPATGMATLAVGPVARLNAPGLLAALDRYPYGCTEQITSGALPLLYLSSVAEAMGLSQAKDIDTRIAEAVTEVLANQSPEGAFGLWGPSAGDFWLDAFVTDFLSRARAQGHAVPDTAFRMALDNLRNRVNYEPDFDLGGEALAYALMVLAREGAASIGDLRYYADVKADSFATATAQAQLGAALASYGDQTRADTMFRKAAARLAPPLPEPAQVFRADYGTATRDAAVVLALATESGSQAIDAEAIASGLAGRSTGVLSTQEATWMLLAANALMQAPGAEGLTVDGVPVAGPVVRVQKGATAPVVVTNGSDRVQTVTVTAYGIPTEPEPAGGNGYDIKRSYYTMDGQPVDMTQPVPQGTRMVVVLEVTAFNSGEARLMVADPLPAGFEIDNPNLIAGGSTAALSWLTSETEVQHSEFRQDRFLTAIDRYSAAPFKLAYIVRAVSPGIFRHPAASVEDMYRPDFRARSETGQVVIAE
jgi:hypothetical protein